ncbi:hypothetical protein N6H18_07500 [Reichenbachiella agarivorans]|uniref:Phosphate-selective porin O and P n=1 Tax=Reichenbachiella agarivorans TaxID=2979464 RepID=A0ABY6CTE6_9BACT|nr:hypothetical protein [Reichenbachiella agarivorans]UXP33792.1 hypothetical protein N6H18_07500 [Reichenbachiella agarivorans]
MKQAFTLTVLYFLLQGFYVIGQDSTKVLVDYGLQGLSFTYGDYYKMNMQWHLQFRYANLTGANPDFYVDDEDNLNGSFNIQRARIKVSGHAFKPYVEYYLMYDFPSNKFLNWDVTIKKMPELQFRLGQWKVNYNTERYVSADKQLMVDRSLVNRFFTFDRQIGMMVMGDIFEGKRGSSRYQVSLYNGEGLNTDNENRFYLWTIRYQWNFSRTNPKMFFADIERSQKVTGFLAAAIAENTSGYTQFSSEGGGQLLGFAAGTKNQYRLRQATVQMMLKHKGFSMMTEAHLKNVYDNESDEVTEIHGGYIQGGYFLNEILDWIPKPLQLAGRIGVVHQDNFSLDQREWTIGANWFLIGHNNKLTFDFSRLDNVDFEDTGDEYRMRVQWNFSF